MPKRKPVVFYRPVEGGRILLGKPAIVMPTNHPGPYVSNTKEIITTPVEVYDPRDGEFHTRNTIYRLLKD